MLEFEGKLHRQLKLLLSTEHARHILSSRTPKENRGSPVASFRAQSAVTTRLALNWPSAKVSQLIPGHWWDDAVWHIKDKHPTTWAITCDPFKAKDHRFDRIKFGCEYAVVRMPLHLLQAEAKVGASVCGKAGAGNKAQEGHGKLFMASGCPVQGRCLIIVGAIG